MIIYSHVIPPATATTENDHTLTRSRCSRNLIYILVKNVMGGGLGGGR